jgi:hypothetical protein
LVDCWAKAEPANRMATAAARTGNWSEFLSFIPLMRVNHATGKPPAKPVRLQRRSRLASTGPSRADRLWEKNNRRSFDFLCCAYHVIWVTKYRYKALQGEIAVRTRDLPRAGGGDRAGRNQSWPRTHAGERASVTGASQAGAVHEREVEPCTAGRISPVEESLLRPALVGAGVFLCERRRGG